MSESYFQWINLSCPKEHLSVFYCSKQLLGSNFCFQVGPDQHECLSACHDQVNSVSVTSSDFPNRETFVRREEFCLTLNKLRR